jgi:hypothetical protein
MVKDKFGNAILPGSRVCFSGNVKVTRGRYQPALIFGRVSSLTITQGTVVLKIDDEDAQKRLEAEREAAQKAGRYFGYYRRIRPRKVYLNGDLNTNHERIVCVDKLSTTPTTSQA